jgi:heterodisulfide reductase subunit C2
VDRFSEAINAIAHTDVSRCYQCGRCTGNCPMAAEMDRKPHQVVRMALLDMPEVLDAASVWLCDGCHTCSERCPREINVAGVFDALRQVTTHTEAPLAVFNRSLLTGVRRMGRVNEAPLGLDFHVRMRRSPTSQSATIFELLRKGKLPLVPHRQADLSSLFAKVARGPEEAKR